VTPPERVFPAVWPSARGIWCLLGCGSIFALAAIAPVLLPVALGASALFAALLIADLALGPQPDQLRLAREPVDRLALRRAHEVAYRIENRSGTPLALGLIEPSQPLLQFSRDELRGAVPARSVAHLRQEVRALDRGLVRFVAIYCWIENRIGLLRRRFRTPAPEEVRVFPDLSGVEEYGSLARRATLVDAGLRRLRMRGVGTEFESVRDYAAGDNFRDIEWKSTARRGRLMIAQHETERSQNVIVVLDCGRLMTPRIGAQRKFDYALTAGLSAARIAQAADDNVGLTAFAARTILRIRPRRGKAHVAALAAAAYDLQPRLEEPDYERAFAELKSEHSKRSLIVFFTDIFDPSASAGVLASLGLLVPRHVVMCVLMNDEAIGRALAHEPRNARDAYRTSVAMRLSDERAAAIGQLRARGIIVVDAPATKLTIALLDAYLDVKARGLL
jgi:uncharacterized protein (DUF58 family)